LAWTRVGTSQDSAPLLPEVSSTPALEENQSSQKPVKLRKSDMAAAYKAQIRSPVPNEPLRRMADNRKQDKDEARQRYTDQVTKLAINNPFVPIGLAATTFCMCGIAYSIFSRNRMNANFFMRARIACQFFTFAACVGGAILIGRGSGEHSIFSRKDTPRGFEDSPAIGIVGDVGTLAK